jgi:hypothetical protein
MPRNIDPATLAAMAAPNVRIGLFVQLTFATTTQYVWTGQGNITWNGNTYLGVGYLGSVSTIQEDSTVQAQGISIQLQGITADDLSEALTEVHQGLPAKVYTVFFNADGTIIGTPILSFSGKMDQPEINEAAETATITISCENRMAELNRSREQRLTLAEQQLHYPGDNGFQFVNSIIDWVAAWGSSS